MRLLIRFSVLDARTAIRGCPHYLMGSQLGPTGPSASSEERRAEPSSVGSHPCKYGYTSEADGELIIEDDQASNPVSSIEKRFILHNARCRIR